MVVCAGIGGRAGGAMTAARNGGHTGAVAGMGMVSGPIKLLCDEMLQRLGRWLRAAGHDTAIALAGVSDLLLLERASAEGRVLLTCDREIALRRGARGSVITLTTGGLEANARELGELMGIDWLHAPFTRCLLDNAPLNPAGRDDRARVPPKALLLHGRMTSCPECARIYWPGSHVRRMHARLENWQR